MLKLGTLLLIAASFAIAADSQLVIDRGLPQTNLNNESGAGLRSNIRWSLYRQGFVGDTLQIGQPGEFWVIDRVRVWAVPGVGGAEPAALGDVYQDVRLYFGTGDVTPVATARLAAGSNESANENVAIGRETEGRAVQYEDFGANLNVWRIEFQNLDLAVEGGKAYNFAPYGMGRAMEREHGEPYPWFSHGSNAELSGAKQDGANGKLLLFEPSGLFDEQFDSRLQSWNKSSDLNVQVWAHQETQARQDAAKRKK